MRDKSGTLKPVLAMDIGGTKILAAVVSDRGEILARQYHLTLAAEGPGVVIGRLASAAQAIAAKAHLVLSDLHGISVATAGAIDMKNGVVTLSPNLPGWRDIPLRDILRKELHEKTFLLHDAGAAAIGEHRWGAGTGVTNLIYVTVSTGIGGGIIIDGKLYTGHTGGAGEIGHMTIDINGQPDKCGNTGCLETLASGTALAAEAKRRIRAGENSLLNGMVGGNLEDITAEKVSIAAEAGDALSQRVITAAATWLGVGLVNLVNIFNPEMIIIGGGVSRMGDRLLGPAKQVVQERAFPQSAQVVRIVLSRLGEDAGILGAAAFAYSEG